VARGNFVVSADWSEGKPTKVSIHSKSGGTCRLASSGIGAATVKDSKGNAVQATGEGNDRIQFETTAGETYFIQP
jgi:alpha-L-fucosidase 2